MPDELPEEIEKACDDGRTVPWDEWSRNLCRALLAEVRRMVPVLADADLARAMNDTLKECERRYARREEPLERHTDDTPPPKEPEVEPCPWCLDAMNVRLVDSRVGCAFCGMWGPVGDSQGFKWNKISRAARGVR